MMVGCLVVGRFVGLLVCGPSMLPVEIIWSDESMVEANTYIMCLHNTRELTWQNEPEGLMTVSCSS